MRVSVTSAGVLGLKICVLAGMLACFEGGGSDDQNQSGYDDHGSTFTPDFEGGVDVIITPQGDRLLAATAVGNLYVVDLETRAAIPVDDVQLPSVANFSRNGRWAYVYSGPTRRLVAIDLLIPLRSRTTIASSLTVEVGSGTHRYLDVSPDDGSIVLSDASGLLEIVDTASFSPRAAIDLADRVVDLDFAVDSRKALVTGRGGGFEAAQVHFVDLDTAAARVLEVPNCADELVIADAGRRAFLAPTFCRQPGTASSPSRMADPISVIDVETETFVQNLPGFGPVYPTPDQRTVVGFAFAPEAAVAEGWAPGAYLVFVDTRTLFLSWTSLGTEQLPSYWITPDGTSLVVNTWDATALTIVDVESREITPVSGVTDALILDDFVSTRDGDIVYFRSGLQSSLFRLDVALSEVRPLPLAFDVAGLNILPDDSRVVLAASTPGAFHLLDTSSDQLVGSFTVP